MMHDGADGLQLHGGTENGGTKNGKWKVRPFLHSDPFSVFSSTMSGLTASLSASFWRAFPLCVLRLSAPRGPIRAS